MVRDGDCTVRVSETISRVRAMETKPESERISAASRMVSEGRGETKGRRERRKRETRGEAAIDGEYEVFGGRVLFSATLFETFLSVLREREREWHKK